jgi:hypothetical protein
MVMSPARLGPENDCTGETTVIVKTDPSSHQTGRPTSTNPKLSDSNKNLVLGPKWGLTPRQTGRLTVCRNVTLTFDFLSQSVLREIREPAVSSWKTESTEVFANGRPWWKHGRRGKRRSPHCRKSLRSNAEYRCEIDASQCRQKLMNTEAEGSAALEAVARQPVKKQLTENI